MIGVELDWARIEEIKERYPEFHESIPKDAVCWSEAEMEAFFESNGAIRPVPVVRLGHKTCALLSRVRTHLAAEHINGASAEYLAFCHHLQERCRIRALPIHFLPTVAKRTEVDNVAQAPHELVAPVVIRGGKVLDPARWGLDFWEDNFGNERCQCRARSPVHKLDKNAVDTSSVEGSVGEYAEYARIVEELDPECLEDNALAFPRVQIEGWAPFPESARDVLETLRELAPMVHDITDRLAQKYASVLNADWTETHAGFYSLFIGVLGTISRLRVENHRAHAWIRQIQGKRLYYLFAPEEADKLYRQKGGFVDVKDGYAACVSPVSVFLPDKECSLFGRTVTQWAVLEPGDTLVVPPGWWRCAVSLETSVTLTKRYWTKDTRKFFVDDLQESPRHRDAPLVDYFAKKFAHLREIIASDVGWD